ncbi:MAG: enoyl-CoA hydratase/isomerase family protein [Burkholderiales bacterium]|jgi:enoyl-CoA hydratase|nr:enoyl-CoA hydratase/isomerase family protein [Burkholderiales bacterium]
MDYTRYQRIRFDRRDRVLTLTLHRPDKPASLNAVDEPMHRELSQVFYDVALDDEADVLVITGDGTAFSSGGDIEWMSRTTEASATEGKKLLQGLLDLEKPIIARINGAAIGLGATIALFCDLAYALDDARIADPHVRVGLVAGDGGAIIWPALIGSMRAKRYLLTGDAVSGREAAAMGLVNESHPTPEALDAAVYGMAERLARGATRAIRWTKIASNIALKQLAQAVMEASFAYEIHSFKTEDHREAVAAFLDKRKPTFVGR